MLVRRSRFLTSTFSRVTRDMEFPRHTSESDLVIFKESMEELRVNQGEADDYICRVGALLHLTSLHGDGVLEEAKGAPKDAGLPEIAFLVGLTETAPVPRKEEKKESRPKVRGQEEARLLVKLL